MATLLHQRVPETRLHRPHSALQVPVDAKKLTSEVAAAAAGAPRKRGPRPSRKEAEENAVRRVSLGWLNLLLCCICTLHGGWLSAECRECLAASGKGGAPNAALGRFTTCPALRSPQVVETMVKHIELEEVKSYTGGSNRWCCSRVWWWAGQVWRSR